MIPVIERHDYRDSLKDLITVIKTSWVVITAIMQLDHRNH